MTTFADRVKRLAKAFKDFQDTMTPETREQFDKLAPEQRDWFARQMYHDTLVPGVGNKRAHQDFLSRPRQGVHVLLDLNDFKSINDIFSYAHGDQAITSAGKAFSEASRANRGKLFRTGGDEFHAHFDTPEQAYAFLRHASTGLGNMVPIGGHHKVSFSAGLGASPEQANAALHQAKTAKTARYGSFRAGNAQVGHGQHFVHSLLPGAAGPVSTTEESAIPHELQQRRTAPISVPDVSQSSGS